MTESNSRSVTELTMADTGRWRVTTRTSTHYLDLDARTTVRVPGASADPTINDRSRPLRSIEVCRVGESGRWTMHAEGSDRDDVDFFWAITSEIRSIEKDDAHRAANQ